MTGSFTESIIEEAALIWLRGLGYALLHGPDIAAGMPGAERSDPNYRDVTQARNIDGSLAINAQGLRAGPVLLVDDMVDSRWTLTVAAWLLRSHGSGEVLPLALARVGQYAGHDE